MLRNFLDDTKLSDVADMLDGRDAIQRDLNRFEQWACKNLMKFNKIKCRVLNLAQGKPQNQYILGDEGIGSSPVEKYLGILENEKLDLSSQWAFATKAHKKNCGEQIEGSGSFHLLCSAEIHLEYYIQLWGLQHKKGMNLLDWVHKMALKNDWRERTHLLWGKVEVFGGVQPGREKASGTHHCDLSMYKRGLSERQRKTFYQGCSDRTRATGLK